MFEAKRRTRRFHSDTCQKRAKRGQVINLDARRPSPEPPSSSVLTATTAEMERLEASESTLGQMALALALRIDVGAETGAATAALARELRATMEAIEARAPLPEGKVSSLRLRLLERTQGA